MEIAVFQKALTPIILEGIAADYIADPRYNKSLQQEATGERPQQINQFLRGPMFGLINCYRATGTSEYDWHSFGPDLDKSQWDFYSFDPPESRPVESGARTAR